MAAGGFFTYYDLYGGKAKNYHNTTTFRLPSTTEVQHVPIPTTTIISFPPTTNLRRLVSSTTTESNNKLQKLIKFVPFAYFHWFLIVLAVLLTLSLIIIFICYCRSHCRKNNKSRNEKKQSLPSFYRYRTAKQHVPAYNIYESTAPPSFFSPTRSLPSKSVECLNKKLLRQGLDAVGSPQIPRTDVSRTAPSSTFSSTASDLLVEMKGRLSNRSTEPSFKAEQFYETQRAQMALNDDSKNGSLLIDMN